MYTGTQTGSSQFLMKLTIFMIFLLHSMFHVSRLSFTHQIQWVCDVWFVVNGANEIRPIRLDYSLGIYSAM